MHRMSKLATASLVAAAAALMATAPAAAKCQKMGFLVNDYGKDGPTKDAKDLLDKHIVKWAADNGVTKYTVGKKDVKCELFLNFVVFDEHTCTAEATVCWDERSAPGVAAAPQQSKKKSDDAPLAVKDETAPPVKAKPAPSPAKAAAAPRKVETGAVAPPPPAPAVTQQDAEAAERAAEAAERAAAAAERAAQAAERAAQAAEDRAAVAPVEKYAAPAAVDAIPKTPDKEKTVAPVPPR